MHKQNKTASGETAVKTHMTTSNFFPDEYANVRLSVPTYAVADSFPSNGQLMARR
jgi:hypothetical protein